VTTYRTADLGEALSEHRFTLGTQVRVIAFVFVGGPILMLVLMAIGTMPLGDDWGPMACLGTALFFLGMPALGIMLWLQVRKRDHDVVRIYDRGLVHVDHGKERFIAWADVDSLTSEVKQTVRNGFPGRVTHRYSLASGGGIATFTHGFEGVEVLADLLRRKTSEVIEPRVQKDLIAKKKVAFGPLSLSLRGIGHEKKILHWRAAVARFDEGNLVVERPDGSAFARETIASVPNAHVFVELVARMHARAIGGGDPENPDEVSEG